MNPLFWIALPVVIAAGAATTLQAPVNSVLGRTLDNTLAAAALSFGVGFLVLSLLTLATGGAQVAPRLAHIQWWHLAGGALGAFYVWASLWGVPVLGVVTTVSALILGQMVVAILLDKFGPLGLPVKEISVQRLFGVVLVAGGLILSRF